MFTLRLHTYIAHTNFAPYAVSKIDINDLITLRDKVKSDFEVDKLSPLYQVKQLLLFRNLNEQLLKVLERAVELVNVEQSDADNWFHYMDFNIYYTRVESKWPWMRDGNAVAFLWLGLFYLTTPILFCAILDDEGICQRREGAPYSGWMSALYFASTTLSTVSSFVLHFVWSLCFQWTINTKVIF